jgi:signal recognition particle subunit SRP54
VFDQLSDRLNAIFSRLTGRGRLSENDVNEVMREVRIALLEADVSLSAAKDFVNRIKEKAVGADVMASLSPAQTIVKIVHDELVELLGPSTSSGQARLQFSDAPPSVIMLVGLQGSGKTTHAGKLALRLKEQGRRTLLVAADVYRPAAIAQLQTLGTQIDLPVFALRPAQDDGWSDPVKIARDGVAEAKRLGLSTAIIDTAGRLQIDEELMLELERIKAAVNPKEILLVADAMTGQEATNIAKTFHDRLGITGVILTKLDGDTRGGAALSIHKITGAPIKFIGVGEKLSAIEPFYPDRLASRILGMGDVLTLIERTQSVYTEEQAKDLEKKLLKQQFTLDDFLDQLRQVRKMGSMTEIMKMIPGLSRALPKDFEIPESEIKRIEAIICSMTRRERVNPDVLNGSRRKRIAQGSGVQVADVNRLVKRFEEARKMMKQMGFSGKKRPRMPMGMLGR